MARTRPSTTALAAEIASWLAIPDWATTELTSTAARGRECPRQASTKAPRVKKALSRFALRQFAVLLGHGAVQGYDQGGAGAVGEGIRRPAEAPPGLLQGLLGAVRLGDVRLDGDGAGGRVRSQSRAAPRLTRARA